MGDEKKRSLETSDNQFGFKTKHSTDMCAFILKETIDFYISQTSPMYLCFLDASKAYDRVNHWHLFKKLLDRKIPCVIIRLLLVWYRTQKFLVKWCDVLSGPFRVSNGVRQGGILSPMLFNVFIDELSSRLAKCRSGCYINNVCLNHLFYADDAVLLCPSPAALQYLIDICDKYAKDNDMIFNTKKSVCTRIVPKQFGTLQVPAVQLNGTNLCWVDTYKYLGIFIDSSFKDDQDIRRQTRAIYARGNMLVSKFRKCTPDVKIQLFKTYCSNIYCGHLWQQYHKTTFKRIKVAYNNVFRSIMNIKDRCSISAAYVNCGVDGFDAMIRKLVNEFRKRLDLSTNNIINMFLRSPFFIYSSGLNKQWCSLIL